MTGTVTNPELSDLAEGDIISVPQYKNSLRVAKVGDIMARVEFTDRDGAAKDLIANKHSGRLYLIAGSTDKGAVDELTIIATADTDAEDDTEDATADAGEVLMTDGGQDVEDTRSPVRAALQDHDLAEGDRVTLAYKSVHSGTVVEHTGTLADTATVSATLELDDGRTFELGFGTVRSGGEKESKTIGYVDTLTPEDDTEDPADSEESDSTRRGGAGRVSPDEYERNPERVDHTEQHNRERTISGGVNNLRTDGGEFQWDMESAVNNSLKHWIGEDDTEHVAIPVKGSRADCEGNTVSLKLPESDRVDYIVQELGWNVADAIHVLTEYVDRRTVQDGTTIAYIHIHPGDLTPVGILPRADYMFKDNELTEDAETEILAALTPEEPYSGDANPRGTPMTDGGRTPRDILLDVSEGDTLTITLDGPEGERPVSGVVDAVDLIDHHAETLKRGIALATGGGEYVYDITVDKGREDAPVTASRTVFADTAADLGRIPEDASDDPDEYIILDEGTVTAAEPGVESDD